MHPLILKYTHGEIVVSQGKEVKALTKAISAAVKHGELKKIAPTVYSTSIKAPDAEIIRRNTYAIIGALYPGAIVSHRSAMEGGVTAGNIVLTYIYTKKVTLPGLTIHLFKGKNPLKDDLPFVGSLFMSSPERAWLENCQISSGKDYKKVISKDLYEKDLENYLGHHGDEKFRLRMNRVHEISQELEMPKAWDRFKKIAGALLGTRSASHLQSPLAIARAIGLPFDQDRCQLLEKLYERLKDATKPRIEPSLFGEKTDSFITNLCFFDAYFSNYIEGTRFEVDEAKKIVFDNDIPKHRPEGHDVRATFTALYQVAYGKLQAFKSSDEFIDWIKKIHREIMEQHPSKIPGEFKAVVNVAGNTRFVVPELVIGTIRKAFEYYPSLDDGYPKALFLKFLLAEIHPFTDGNGRLSRIVLNRELYRSNQWPIIIPTVFRSEYLDSLRKLTRSRDPEVYIKAMSKAANFTRSINFFSFESAYLMLKTANAFSEEQEDFLLSVTKQQ